MYDTTRRLPADIGRYRLLHPRVAPYATACFFGTFATDLVDPDFTGIARAAGLFGARVEKASDLEDALRAAFAHDGPALVDVRTARQELSLPPKLTYEQIKGFTLFATRTVLSGEGTELIELAKTNLRELAVE